MASPQTFLIPDSDPQQAVDAAPVAIGEGADATLPDLYTLPRAYAILGAALAAWLLLYAVWTYGNLLVWGLLS